MSGKTISIAKGKGCLNHNNRKFLTPNIDEKRVKQNVTYIKQDIKEAYQQIFGQAVDEYNAKQKRKDRKIDNYYEKLRKSKNGEQLFHEIIVQIGDKENSGYGMADFYTCLGILDDYMSNFQERNKHLHVFNAVMHLDESTPHLHISFIPIGEGYKTGLTIRNSLSKAMEVYSTEDKVGILGWYEQERNVLTQCAKNFNIEITSKNAHRPHLNIHEYKKTMEELETLQEAKNALKQDIQALNDKKIAVEDDKKQIEEVKPTKILGMIPSHEYEELQQKAISYRSEWIKSELEKDEAHSKINVLNYSNQLLQKENQKLRNELIDTKKNLKDVINQKGNELSQAKSRELELTHQCQEWEKAYNHLKKSFNELKTAVFDFLQPKGLVEACNEFILARRERKQLEEEKRRQQQIQKRKKVYNYSYSDDRGQSL